MTFEQIVEYVAKNLKKTGAKQIDKHLAVQIDIYGEGEGAFYVEVDEGKIKIAPYEYYEYDAKIIVSCDELVKILKHEKTPQQSFAEGLLGIEGNIDAARALINLIKAPAKKTATKKEPLKSSAQAEKEIVRETKKKNSKVAKDIKK